MLLCWKQLSCRCTVNQLQAFKMLDVSTKCHLLRFPAHSFTLQNNKVGDNVTVALLQPHAHCLQLFMQIMRSCFACQIYGVDLPGAFFDHYYGFLFMRSFPHSVSLPVCFFIVVLLHIWVLSRSRWHKIREVKQTPVTSVVFVLKSQLLRQAEVLRLKKTLWLIRGFKMPTNSFKEKKWLFYHWPSHPRMSDDHIVSWLLWDLFLICSDKTVRRER